MSEELLHYGKPRRSGRYPWGSGQDPQRSKDLLSILDELRGKGMKETEIAKELGMNTSELRSAISWAGNERKRVLQESVVSRKERGDSNIKIANDLGMSESSVRNYLKTKDTIQTKQVNNVADALKKGVTENEFLDIGVGVERQIGVSRAKLKAAVNKLKEEGYTEHDIYVKRLTDPSKYTTVRVLTKEKDLEVVKANSDKIKSLESWTEDGGLTMNHVGPIKHIDWDRVDIRYKEDGGIDKDGVIEIRRGVKDLDMGASSYAQVRIAVGKDKYLKGMAMYSDDMPSGKDILFNTNKEKNVPKEKVLKDMKMSNDNPFGATIQRQNGALNIVNEEGDWRKWKSSLSAQFLSKQPKTLVKERLDETFSKVKDEFNELNSLTNPVVKKYLIDAYSDGLITKAQHLKAQGLPRTRGHVILPFPSMKPDEVYAPNYKDGERVVLVRYPHGGTFELPELTVNNKGPGRKSIHNAVDAIGIHPSVASKLSGADFDGDTVYVIPNNQKKIKTSRALKELKDFDPNKYAVDHVTITPKRKQQQMGEISNLITDMTIKGASQSERARAVKHSMVVIDSEKHKLDYKRSAEDNGISALQKKYQTHTGLDGKQHRGASTLISKSKHEVEVAKNKDLPIGKETYIDKNGKKKTIKTNVKKVPLIQQVGDVNRLSSGTAVEKEYADYANKVLSLSGRAKKVSAGIQPPKRNPIASKKYEAQVKTLDAKLNKALLNAPRERRAQLLAAKAYYKDLDYNMTSDQKKKLKSQALAKARIQAKANRAEVDITPDEWKAIQSGAVSTNKLIQIMNNANLDKIKEMATPRTQVKMSTAKVARVQGLLAKGYTYAEIANDIGVSVSTIRSAMKEE